MDRRSFLRRTGAGALTGVALAGEATASADEDDDAPADGTAAYQSKVTTIRSPLSGVPTVEEAGDELRVELDADAGVTEPSASLEPSFGAGTAVELERLGVADGTSDIWNADEGEDDDVTVARYRVPELDRAFSPGLYDLRVEWSGGTDRQPRAVRVYDEIPDDPKVVVMGDPQLGDPRYLRTGFGEARDERDPEPFVQRAKRGTGTPTERWGATRKAVSEVNAVDPDFVIVTGDLTLGQDAPGKYYAEYEDAWDILNELRAPTFCTLGNHDGYVQSGIDGKALFRETFGPPSYTREVGDLRLVAVDTYDWSYLDRLSTSVAVSTYGGQVQDDQLAWLREGFEEWVEEDGALLAFGHHNPSWQPDPENRFRERTHSHPGLEQIGRGSRIVESGQLWTGENQFALRELFDEAGVAAYFSGHSHRDRIARTVGDGVADVAETHGPRTASPGYHYVRYRQTAPTEDDPDGEYGEYDWTVDPGDRSDDDVVSLLRAGEGTLYVGCTTTQSSTGQYWGWRPLTVDSGEGHLDPGSFGYPWSEEGEDALDRRAVSPGAWDASQDEVGLYSHPSYRLSVSRPVGGADHAVVEVDNDLAVPVDGAVVQSLSDSPGLRVENADVVWRRHADDEQAVKLAFEVPAEGTTRIVVETRGPDAV